MVYHRLYTCTHPTLHSAGVVMKKYKVGNKIKYAPGNKVIEGTIIKVDGNIVRVESSRHPDGWWIDPKEYAEYNSSNKRLLLL